MLHSCVDDVDAWGQRPIITGEENVATIERACVDLFTLTTVLVESCSPLFLVLLFFLSHLVVRPVGTEKALGCFAILLRVQ